MGDKVDHSLVNPNQLRHFGITVQDNPYCCTQMHLSTEDEDVVIPLMSDGTVIHFSSRTPTEKELHECRRVELSSEAEWNPRDVSFPEAPDRVEEGKLMSRVSAIQVQRQQHNRSDCNCDVSIHLELPSIVERLISEVRVTDVLEDVPQRRTFVSNERHCSVSAAELRERWGIGLTQASNTIGITTQTGVRSAIMPLSRRYKADRVFKRPLMRGQFFTDTMDGRLKSLDGNKYAQIFATKELFVVAYPMQSKTSAGEGLRQFVHEYGRPEHLTFDGSREQCGKETEFMKNVRKYSINYRVTEPDCPNHNSAEGVIQEICKKWFRIMVKKHVPKQLWDYGLWWVCEIQNRTSNTSRGLNGRCPLEMITGESVNISEYLDFGFYDWIWYKDNAGHGETKLGRWLDVSHQVGPLMSFWILTAGAQVLSRTTVQRVTNLELQVVETIARCRVYDNQISDRLGDAEHYLDGDGKVTPSDWVTAHGHDPEFQEEFQKVISASDVPEVT